MKLLLIAILVAAGLWAGYWVIGAQRVKSGVANWFAARQAEGWVADHSTLQLRGFPNRFDTTLTDVTLADPDTGWAWEAPFFQLFALSYKPTHVIAVWPDHQMIATPFAKFDVSSAKLQASLITGKRRVLNRANLAAETLQINKRGEDATTMTALNAAVHRVERSTASYRFALSAEDLAPAASLRGRIDLAGDLPRTLSAFQADLTVIFDRAWDMRAVEHQRPQPTHINVALAEAKWGELELALAGEVTVDPQGVPTGRMTIKARNWLDILDMAVAGGAVSDPVADKIEGGLKLLAAMSGNTQTLDLPLDFRDGKVMLGPLPLGPAPILRLR